MAMTPQEKDYGEAAIQLAFEAGRWLGQVDLEEFYDREQYSYAALQSAYSRKTCMPLDKETALNKGTIRVKLRSDEWREGVKKSVKQYLDKSRKLLFENTI